MNLDLGFIRDQYPVFQDPQTARCAMFESSVKAGEAMDAGYPAMAHLLNCDPDELTLGEGAPFIFPCFG